MRSWYLLVSAIALVTAAVPSRAAAPADIADCQQMQDIDKGIAGCTKIAEHQGVPASDRAIAYFDRGVDYYAKNDLDHAIADWSEAIKLNPDYVHAYNDRAKAYLAKADYNDAIADYSQAIKLDARHALAYKGRGISYLLSGQTDKAENDFRQAVALDPSDQYAVLWLDIATRRNNQPSHIAQSTVRLNMTAWPAPLLFLFAGQMNPHDVAVAAQNIDPAVTRARQCDAYFFIGESMLLKGDKNQAADLFQHALKQCSETVDEYSAAAAELKALGKPVPAPAGGDQDPGVQGQGDRDQPQGSEGAKPPQ